MVPTAMIAVLNDLARTGEAHAGAAVVSTSRLYLIQNKNAIWAAVSWLW